MLIHWIAYRRNAQALAYVTGIILLMHSDGNRSQNRSQCIL